MFDPTKYDDTQRTNYVPVPPGEYLCKVKSVEVDSTKTGSVMWKLQLKIETEGQFYGSVIFDNIIFSQKAGARAKHMFKGFGIDVSAPRDYQADELNGCYAMVTVDRFEKYHDEEGKEKEKAGIAYFGYRPVELKEEAENDLPF